MADLVYYSTCCIVLTVVLRRFIGAFGLRAAAGSALRTILATAVGAGACTGLLFLLPGGTGVLEGLVHLVVCGSVGLVVTFGLCALLRIPEMQVVSNLVNRLFGRFARRGR